MFKTHVYQPRLKFVKDQVYGSYYVLFILCLILSAKNAKIKTRKDSSQYEISLNDFHTLHFLYDTYSKISLFCSQILYLKSKMNTLDEI